MRTIFLLLSLCFCISLIVSQLRSEEEHHRSIVFTSKQRAIDQYYSIAFDPKSCNDEKNIDFIFLAIRRNVFRVKFDDKLILGYIQRIAPELIGGLPIPPRKDKPEGCFGNPIQVDRFKVDDFRLADIRHSGEPAFNQFMWDTISKFDNAQCGKDGAFIYCRQFTPPPTNASTPPVSEMAAVYKADPAVYTTPDGSPFIIYCNFAGGQGCEYSYKLFDHVVVTHGFTRYDLSSLRQDNSRPYARSIESQIASDTQIRKAISGMLVKDYPWRDTGNWGRIELHSLWESIGTIRQR